MFNPSRALRRRRITAELRVLRFELGRSLALTPDDVDGRERLLMQGYDLLRERDAL